jgi:hypothetical protein
MNVSTILAELAKTVGVDAMKEACQSFVNGGASGKVKKVKRERKPRGKSSWNLEVDGVRQEMMAAHRKAHPSASQEDVDKAVSYKMAFAEASRRRRATNPEAQAKYEEYKQKADARRAERKAKKEGKVTPAPAEEADAEADHGSDAPSQSARVCPECEDPVPAPRGAVAGGDGSHRMCLFRGMNAGKWRNPTEWEEAAKAEGKRRADIAVAEAASSTVQDATAAAEPKKRGRPAKKATNA